MQPKYKIIESNPTLNQIVVRYYTDTLPESFFGGIGENGEIIRGTTDLAINLPFPPPTEDELHILIAFHFNAKWFAAVEASQNLNYTAESLSIPLNTEKEIILPAAP